MIVLFGMLGFVIGLNCGWLTKAHYSPTIGAARRLKDYKLARRRPLWESDGHCSWLSYKRSPSL